MERQKDLMLPTSSLKGEHLKLSKSTIIFIAIIILFHLVGLIGFSVISLRPLFLKIVPYHLLLMMLVIVFNHYGAIRPFLLFALIIYLSGFFIEYIGVHKGWLFGSYTYGNTLGTTVYGIPLTVGINWFLLVYATGVLMQRTRLKKLLPRVITGALILTVLDVLIEQVAARFDYWHWANDVIPVKNYLCWFIASAVMLFVFEKFNFKKQNMVAPILLLAQFIFFIILNLIA